MSFEENDTHPVSALDRNRNANCYPNVQSELITPFILPSRPECDKYTTGKLSGIADAKFFINVHNNLRYLTLEYEYEFDAREGPQQLMIYAFYVEKANNGRIYKFYLETPGDEHYPLYILELTYLPLVYTMDIQSRQYLSKFVEHNSHDTELPN